MLNSITKVQECDAMKASIIVIKPG